MEWQGIKTLVTGAGGFIGSHLVEELFALTHGLSEDVVFTGYYSEDRIIDVIGTFDIFVLPSLYEGCPT